MIRTLSNESAVSDDRAIKREATNVRPSRLGEKLDEIAVFAFVAVAVIYIAAAT